MGRKKKSIKRALLPDPRYHSELVTRFINNLMLKGKKSLAERLFYQAMDIIKERSGQEPLEVFQKALENVKPFLEVRSRRVGGATYQVPVEVSQNRRTALAIRWILDFSRARKGMAFSRKLAAELMDAYQNQGSAIKKKQNVHKMAEANKAFAHYRW
ncbi:MAG: 30S ribosomal protein S7 [Candidatus Euphemobacter frigidus]|nr:30S ribosomal protein S7 [Candidatus Euphemobacter frigidus]MDP8275331.1 30S ribosomal protein S7 [Candidatus Euphemobacter frigidus]